MVLTLVLHAVIVWVLVSGIARKWDRTLAAGPVIRSTTPGGGGGREHGVAYISLPAAPKPAPAPVPQRRLPVAPRPAPPVVTPQVLPPPVPVETLSATSPAPIPADTAGGAGAEGAGSRTGGGTGGGTGAGTGPGAGAGAGGQAGRGTAPEPRQLVLPPADYPKDMRGHQVEVTFYVAPDGRVERIDVVPGIRDGGFARRFAEAMRDYRFRPARSAAGSPVPGTTTVTIFF